MFVVDSLVVVGVAVASLGTIHETDGVQHRTFCLRNAGEQAVSLEQGYTSCGCTTIDYSRAATLQPGDTTHVTLHFNPRGKGGEFYESGTIAYRRASNGQVSGRKFVQMAMDGICITSEETLLRQFPIRVSERIRLSADHFDLGRMSRGEKKERNVVVLHQDEENRQELIPVTFVVDESVGKGLQHVVRSITTRCGDASVSFNVVFDVLVE